MPAKVIKKKRRKKSKMYFGTPVQNAIIRYNTSENPVIKNRIYREHIEFAFNKLAENLIHTFKFYYTEVDDLEDLKHEVICFLLEKLDYFKPDKGSKAFSYFSIVGKNYLISQKYKQMVINNHWTQCIGSMIVK